MQDELCLMTEGKLMDELHQPMDVQVIVGQEEGGQYPWL